MAKKSKASGIMKLLKQGYTVYEIKNRMAVSESYIHAIKKQMLAAGVEAEVENDDDVVRPRLVGPHKVMRVTKAEQEAIKAGEFIQADTNVDAILNARGSNYGSFEGVAGFAQVMKGLIRDTQDGRGAYLPADQCEALDMIASKIARIVNGNADYVDSWIDIAGYATLVADRLQGKSR